MRMLLLLAVLLAKPALAQVTIENAWTRATPPHASLAVGYMTIRNGFAAPDRMVSVSSPAAEKVEMHVTYDDGGVAHMREVKAYEVPEKGKFDLAPGGAHLMFVNIKAPFKAGAKVPVVLRFEKGGEVRTELAVRPIGSSAHDHGSHKGH